MCLTSTNMKIYLLIFIATNVQAMCHSKRRDVDKYFSHRFCPSNVEMNHLAIDESTGFVFVAAMNKLFQLDKALSIVANVSTGPKNDSVNCIPLNEDCQYPLKLTNNTNKLLLIDKRGDRLISCGSIYLGACTARKLTNISKVTFDIDSYSAMQRAYRIASTQKDGSTVGIITEGPTINNPVLYVAVTRVKTLFRGAGLISTHSLYFDHNRENKLFKYAISLNNGNSGSALAITENTVRDYKYIFESGGEDGFIYYVFSRSRSSDKKQTHRSFVARTCKQEILYFSYLEIPVDCVKDGSLNLILGAYYALDENNNEGTLYVLFKTATGSAVCSFNKKKLDDLFYETVEVCYKYNGMHNGTTLVHIIQGSSSTDCSEPVKKTWLNETSNLSDPIVRATRVDLDYYKDYEQPRTPVFCGTYYLPYHLTRTEVTTGKLLFQKKNATFSAITTSRVHGTTVGFIGTEEGSILQVNFDVDHQFNEIEVGEKILSDFVWDMDKDIEVPHVYVTSASQILHMRVAACEKYTSCNTCLESRNPYCGWCILERRCSTNKECKTASKDKDRWLPTGKDQCIWANPPTPKERTLSSAVAVTVNLLPDLDGEDYECLFDGQYSFAAIIINTNQSLTTLSCDTPSDQMLPPSFNNEDYVNVSLSVLYNKTMDIVSTVAMFYECGVYGSKLEIYRPCAGCLSSRWQCNWCVKHHSCKPPESTLSGCIYDKNVCPTILSVSPVDNVIPVGQPHSITLAAKNLPRDGNYTCEVEFGSVSTPVMAKISESRDQVICETTNYTYSENQPEAKAYIMVSWKPSFVVDFDRQDNSSITFYKCSALRDDCSLCVTADPKFLCGWCQASDTCTIKESCHANWITEGQGCPAHEILSISPTTGPTAGGTLVRIRGTNMGTKASDVEKVTIGNSACQIDPAHYQVSVEVVCRTGAVTTEIENAKVSVKVKGKTKTFSGHFQYRNPTLLTVSPKIGPMAGGTLISITGKHLDTGSRPEVWIGYNPQLPCVVVSRVGTTMLNCTTHKSARILANQDVVVKFDKLQLSLPGNYSYTANPQIKNFYTHTVGKLTSFLSGGRSINVTGINLNSVQFPRLLGQLKQPNSNTLANGSRRRTARDVLKKLFRRSTSSRVGKTKQHTLPANVFDSCHGSGCTVVNNTFMRCYSPQFDTNESGSEVLSSNTSVTWIAELKVEMDDLKIPVEKPLYYYPNPNFQKLKSSENKRENELLTIKVYNLNSEAITRNEIIIMIGEKRCIVASIEEDSLRCTIPSRQGEKGQSYDVTVQLGHGNTPSHLGMISYYEDPPPISQGALIAIIVSAVVVFLGIIGFVWCFVKKSKSYKANKDDFQKAMESMEMSVRADFRKAFAELNVDMSDLTADIGDYGIPCLEYRTYVTNLFFPSFKYHPCTKAPDPDAQFPSNMEQGLSQFLRLLSNRAFLTVFIHTLEEQKSFSNRDKGNVSSLLTVALHDKLDYFTEIMKSLVLDLIKVNVQRNPKLILRRSDSVAERMLSNWMYICLYPYLRNKAGSPIFLLLKAIKQQVSKGPLDAVTGKARYTLSDDRLLQEDVENEVLTLFIAPSSNSNDDEPVIVKVLSCDSVAQVKEKVMDAVYKRVPFSQRPKIEQLDLEWRHGRSGHLVLPNQDYTSESGSRWRRLMTIIDYKVGNNATLALIPRQQEIDGSQDLSSMMSNQSTDTSPLSPMLPEDGNTKMYHLVKYSDDIEAKRESTIPRDRHKHIADLYLLRLINMKGILQNYVDAVLQAILDKSSVPCPVMHFFHFLDGVAAQHGITDPEILHMWKTNSLLGRFWVTILKNPESVFDIEKPDTIASSMAVISQTFIDACSVHEHKPTKDSPINKQLYAKEIPNYKKMVQDYYKEIKEQPAISDQDVNAYIADISREHGCKFDVLVAVKELWGYVNKYYEELNESLETDVHISPAVIQRLQQTYNSIDSAVNNGG